MKSFLQREGEQRDDEARDEQRAQRMTAARAGLAANYGVHVPMESM
jgi:hypothetical protein